MKKENAYKLFLAPMVILLTVGCSMSNRSKGSSYKESSSASSDTSTSTSENSNSSSKTSSSSSSYEDSSSEPYIPGDPVLADSEKYQEFWNPSSKLSINIELSREAAEFINDYQYNHDDSTYHSYYVPCTFTLVMNDEEYVFEEVGIRQKGNMSRDHCLIDGHFHLGSLAHYKLSFKETFDDVEYDEIVPLQQFKKTWDDNADRKNRKKRTLFDMEKIDIKWNRNNDQTRSKQAYALKLFRDNGVLAGHSSLADTFISITGDTPINTTYEVLECIDSVFIKRHFDEPRADGDLYKCTYTNRGAANFSSSYKVGDQIGVEDDTKQYHPVYDLKTNKKKNTTHTGLLNLISVINDKKSSASEYASKIEKVMDMQNFMMMESIAYLLGNFDDMRNNANNYYLYIASTTNIAYIIPYDFDRCLGAGAEGRQDYMTSFSPESTKMQCSGNWQTISLYWRTVCTSTSSSSGHANVERVEKYRALYQSNIEYLINNRILSYDTFSAFVNSFPVDYRGNPDEAGYDNTTFADYLQKKIQAIKDNTTYNINI